MFRSFVCAMVAAVTLKLLDPFGSGKIVLFEVRRNRDSDLQRAVSESPSQVTYDKDFHWVELFGFALLGIFGGLYGALFNKANIAWSERHHGTYQQEKTYTDCSSSQARPKRNLSETASNPGVRHHLLHHGCCRFLQSLYEDGRHRAGLRDVFGVQH